MYYTGLRPEKRCDPSTYTEAKEKIVQLQQKLSVLSSVWLKISLLGDTYKKQII